MAPFHVPGWSIKNAPVSEKSSHLSKKRKRPSPRSIALESAEINFEKLVATLKDVKQAGNTSRSTDIGDKRQKKKCRISEDVKYMSSSTNRKPLPDPPTPKNSSETSLKPNKQRKRKQNETKATSALLEPQNTSDFRLTALQKNMKQNLDGARFR
jgi:ribosomal RNA-processing protein 8